MTVKRGHSVRKLSPNVVEVTVIGGRSNEIEFLITSDVHYDSPGCVRRYLKEHLEECRARKALWIDNGDFFDAMQGKKDRRHHKGGLRPEYCNDNYYDALVDKAAEDLGPYEDMNVLHGVGNHESAVLNHNEIDLIQRYAATVKERHKIPVITGGYCNWVIVRFSRDGRKAEGRYLIYLDHGHGGNSPVTHGVIQTNRRNAMIDGADLLVSGHIHKSWYMETQHYALNAKGTEVARTTHHVQAPTYKVDNLGGSGWAREKGFPPPALGGRWVKISFTDPKQGVSFFTTDVSRAHVGPLEDKDFDL